MNLIDHAAVAARAELIREYQRRLHRLFRTEEALQPTHDPEVVAVTGANRQQPRAGLKVRRNRAVSVRTELERDMLGHIVEASDLAERIAGMLRLAADVLPTDSDVALAAGLGPTDQLVEGRGDLGRRNQASLGSGFGLPSGQSFTYFLPAFVSLIAGWSLTARLEGSGATPRTWKRDPRRSP